jgi:hypothetical protein
LPTCGTTWKVLTPNFASAIQKEKFFNKTHSESWETRRALLLRQLQATAQLSCRPQWGALHPSTRLCLGFKEQTDKTAWICLDWVAFSFSAMLGWQKEAQNRLAIAGAEQRGSQAHL